MLGLIIVGWCSLSMPVLSCAADAAAGRAGAAADELADSAFSKAALADSAILFSFLVCLLCSILHKKLVVGAMSDSCGRLRQYPLLGLSQPTTTVHFA